MAIITISRGLYSKGREVAEKVAERLGYRCISHEVIADAAQRFQISQEKMEKAILDAPSIFERITSEKQKYISYLAAEILSHFRNDNVIYHGPAGQFFAPDVAHHLRVRILADMEDRIALMMEREDLKREVAKRYLKKEDKVRKAWSRQFYRVDNMDLSLYDLVIHINKLTVDHAAGIICETANGPGFVTSADSQRAIENLALAANIRAQLLEEYPGCDVFADGKNVEIYVRFTLHSDTMVADKITEKVSKMPEVDTVSVILIPGVLFT